jgi:hypothetical protein
MDYVLRIKQETDAYYKSMNSIKIYSGRNLEPEIHLLFISFKPNKVKIIFFAVF